MVVVGVAVVVGMKSLLWFTVGFGLALFLASTAPQSKIITISDLGLVDSLQREVQLLRAEVKVLVWNDRGQALQFDLFESRFRTLDSLERTSRVADSPKNAPRLH